MILQFLPLVVTDGQHKKEMQVQQVEMLTGTAQPGQVSANGASG